MRISFWTGVMIGAAIVVFIYLLILILKAKLG